MKMQIKQIMSKLNMRRTPLTTILAAGMALVLFAPIAQAKEAPNDDENFGKWQALGEGYVARRRQPPKLDLPKSERQQENVQVRLKHSLKKKQDLLASLEGLSNKDATKVQKKLEKLEKQIAKATLREQQFAAKLAVNGNNVTALWLHTGEEGLYSVSIAELARGLGVGNGIVRENAEKGYLILTTAEEQDSETADRPVSWHFDKESDSVLFVGEVYDTFYSDQNAYLFSLGGKKSKKAAPMKVTKANAANASGFPKPFSESLHFEEEPKFNYIPWAINNEPDADYWFWKILSGVNKTAEVNLNAPDPDSSGFAQIRITLRGFTSFRGAGEHEVSAVLNDVPIGTTLIWSGMKEAILVAEFDQSLLDTSGDNTLILKQGGVEASGELLDSIELDYQRLPVANNGKLWIHNAAAGTQTVSGFNSQYVTVIESPNDKAVLRKDILVEPAGDGWMASFHVKAGVDYFLSESTAVVVSSVHSDNKAGLWNATNSAEYMIIAPRVFSESAEGLAAYRGGRFSNVRIVWLDDIYNEFSAGREDPKAIARFMTYAVAQWSSAPTTVLLLGKGSADHKDRMGYADNFIPVVMSSNPWGLVSSDSRLLGFEGVAPFTIGRLSIINDEEGLAYIDKLRTHESTIVENLEAVLVSDNLDGAGNFYKNSNALAERLTSLGFDSITQLYHPDVNVRESLVQSSTWETSYVSYDGHGGFSQLGGNSEKFINNADARLLQNSTYPVFTVLTCGAGKDIHPGARSLASTLVVNPDGGAIASVAATGASLDAEAQQLSNVLVDSLYGSDRTIGGALQDAKSETRGVISDFMSSMYSVVGDPAVYAK